MAKKKKKKGRGGGLSLLILFFNIKNNLRRKKSVDNVMRTEYPLEMVIVSIICICTAI